MIIDPLTMPQGNQLDPRVNFLLLCCSTHNPLQFDMPHDHVWKNQIFDSPAPPSPTHGA